MLRMLLADDEPIFLSKMEHLLMQYAEQKQLNVQIGAYTRDDMSSFILQPYDIAFLDIDFGNRRGAGIDLARRFGRREMMQLSSLSQAMLNMRLKDMNCVHSGIF